MCDILQCPYFLHILGFLSDSYIVEVTYSMKYREDDADHSVESWFVKVTNIKFS